MSESEEIDVPVEEGELYADMMMKCELEVKEVNDENVVLVHSDSPDRKGSLYPNRMFVGDLEAGRFKRVDHRISQFDILSAFEDNGDTLNDKDPLAWDDE